MVEDKKWFRSKAKVGALLMALGAIGGYLNGSMDPLQTLTAIATALGIFGIRDAQK